MKNPELQTISQPSDLFKKTFKNILFKDLLRVKKIISEDPKRLNMLCWPYPQEGTCDTVRCIGGWLEVIAYLRKYNRNEFIDLIRPPESIPWDYYPRSGKENIGYVLLHNLFYTTGRGWRIIVPSGSNPYQATAEEACQVVDLFITNTKLFLPT